MNQFLDWLRQLFSSWKFWIVVPPWDVGVRVRLGKIAATMAPGPHFRIPFLDEITLVNTRLRIIGTAPVTIGTTKGHAKTTCGFVSYRVADPVRAMLAFSYSEPVVSAKAQALMAITSDPVRCLALLQDEFAGTGVSIEMVSITESAEVRTYRILSGMGQGLWGGGGSPVAVSGMGGGDGVMRI